MEVLIGVDPHKRSHTAVALDAGDNVVVKCASMQPATRCGGC